MPATVAKLSFIDKMTKMACFVINSKRKSKKKKKSNRCKLAAIRGTVQIAKCQI